MKKIWNWFIFLFILAGFPILAWAGYALAVDTYMFWKHGVEKKAEVIALDHTSSSRKGGTTYYYELNIEDNRLVEGFSYKLPVGEYIAVLTLPNSPDKVTLGHKNSSLFEIFSYSIGGDIMALLVISMFIFMVFYGPSALIEVLKAREKWINQ
jgi:hypothetical protein